MSILLPLLIHSLLTATETHNPAKATPAYFEGTSFRQEIPTPEAYFGFSIGEWHLRHDALVGYLKALDAASDRIQLETIGRTHEARPLIHLHISTPTNLAQLEELRQRHLDHAKGKTNDPDAPVFVWMGYSVHGNEPSGANAAALMAYYFAAAEHIDPILEHTVVILDPVLNPDGLDRFATWVNANKGKQPVADAQTREHNEAWPQGRTNHYWFDLNRDWLLLTQPESQARMAQFHRWRPNVLTDHHEMGTEGSFFFQPGIPSRRNPLTPAENVTLTQLIATYHAKALDAQGKFYYSEQSFDDFYYGKGSTYPDIHGAIGILFEQASSRGHLRENSYGPLPFSATIQNQVTTSLSSLTAAYENRARLLEWQKTDQDQTRKDAAADPIKAYVFGDAGDAVRSAKMAQILRAHQIEVHALAKPLEIQGQTLSTGYVVLCQQDQYRLVKTLFETQTTFEDTTFYDVSTWHFPSAFGLHAKALSTDPTPWLGKRLDTVEAPAGSFAETAAPVAYAFSWKTYTAPKAVYALLSTPNIKLRFASQAFQALSQGQTTSFDPGTILIMMDAAARADARVSAKIKEVATANQLAIVPIDSGLTPTGIDLGSYSVFPIKKPVLAMMSGPGTESASVGSLWHLLDAQFQIPVSLLDVTSFDRFSLKAYTHLIIPDGRYELLSEKEINKISRWLEDGGNLICIDGGAKWAMQKSLVQGRIRPDNAENTDPSQGQNPEAKDDKDDKDDNDPKEDQTQKPKASSRIPYAERDARSAVDEIAGAAFAAELDLTHPMAFGFTNQDLVFFRTGTFFVEPAKDPYATPAVYTTSPLVSGYVSAKNLERAKGAAAMIAYAKEDGTVVILPDQPHFRGFWVGPDKLFLNALFLNAALKR